MGRPVLARMRRNLERLWHGLRPPGQGAAARPRARLILCLPPDPEHASVQWSLHTAGGRTERGSGALSTLRHMAGRGTSIEVRTPPHETLLTSVTLPTQSRAKVAQALPFALEEQILGEPEQFHFAYRPLGDGRFAVAVTAKKRLAAWQDALISAGLAPDVLCPANLRLPWGNGDWSVFFEAEMLSVRTGAFEGFSTFGDSSTPPPLFAAALSEARAQGSGPARLRLYNAPPGFDPSAWAVLDLPIDHAAQDPCTVVGEPPPFNLLRGSDDDRNPLLEAVRPALVLLGLWVVAGFLIHLVQWTRLHAIESHQNAEMVALFKRSFPQQTEIVDPAAQMRQAVARLKQQSGFMGQNDLLPLLERVAQSVSTGAPLLLRGLNYRQDHLRLSVTAPGFRALDAFTGRLRAHGLQVKVLTADSRGGVVRGRMEVRSSL